MFKIVFCCAVTAICTTPSFSQQRPWEEIGYASPAGGYSPTAAVVGVTRPGQIIEVAVAGAPPGASGTIYVGSPTYTQVPEGTRVPSLDRELSFVADSEGRATRAFLWPESAPNGLAIQALTGGALSGATLGRSLTAAESTAYSAAVSAASGWDGIQVQGVLEVLSVGDPLDFVPAQDLLVYQGSMPDIDVTDVEVAGLFTLTVSPFLVTTVAQNLATLDPLDIADLTSQLPVQVDDTVVRIDWGEDLYGAFSSYCLIRASAVHYDSFVSNFPASWPPVGPTPTPGGGNIEDLDSEWEAGVNDMWGDPNAYVSGTVVVTCNNGTITLCDADLDSESCFLWDAKITSFCYESGSCCVCRFNAGISSGLKSVSVGAGGGSVSIEGSLGWSRTWQRTRANCCE